MVGHSGGHEQFAARRVPLHAGGDVDGIAERGEVDDLSTDVADERDPRIDRHADLQPRRTVAVPDRGEQVESRPDREVTVAACHN